MQILPYSIEPKSLLSFLNGTAQPERIRFAGMPPEVRRTREASLLRLQPASTTELEQAKEYFILAIRALIDEWIDSGFKGKTEYPKQRSIGAKIRPCVNNWIADDSLQLRIDDLGNLGFNRLGLYHLDTAPEHDDPMADICKALENVLILFLWSELKYRLARCEKCRTYYIRERVKPHYMGATYCKDCRRSTASAKLMRDKRNDAQRSLRLEVKVAEENWYGMSSRQRRKYAGPQEFVLARVNLHPKREILSVFPLTKKWIARNKLQWWKDVTDASR